MDCWAGRKLPISGCSEEGIALDLGSRDRRFESCHPDQNAAKPPMSFNIGGLAAQCNKEIDSHLV